MYKMTSKERFARAFQHKEADRVVMWDFPWPGALRKWHAEGMPENVSYEEYFDVDNVGRVVPDESPRYPITVVEEDDEFITIKNEWGTTVRNFKMQDSTPDFIDHTIIDWDTWLAAKERITPDRDRIQWDYLQKNYKEWVKEGRWLLGDVNFTFNTLSSTVMGMERFLVYMVTDPELCMDMLEHILKVDLQLLDMAWDAGYTFDMLNIRDDMGYKGTAFFSVDMYKQIIKPTHQMAVDWAKKKGIYVRLHSCGNINTLLPEIMTVGFDALHPMEVKAGMDPVQVKKEYGDRLVLHGGFDAMLWHDKEAILAEIRRLLPILKENGGYIFAADHSIPNDVPFENMKAIIALVKELGRFD